MTADIQQTYKIGDSIWINGLSECTIKTNRVQRTITSKSRVNNVVWYGCNIGASMTHYYPAKRIKLVKPCVALMVVAQPKPKLQPLPCTLSVQSKPLAHWRFCNGK